MGERSQDTVGRRFGFLESTSPARPSDPSPSGLLRTTSPTCRQTSLTLAALDSDSVPTRVDGPHFRAFRYLRPDENQRAPRNLTRTVIVLEPLESR